MLDLKKILREINWDVHKGTDQFWTGLNNDKKWMNEFISREIENQSKSIEIISKKYSWIKDFPATSYFVNYQYLLEFIIRFQVELWLTEKETYFFEDWFEDLYIALRLALQWHYRTSYIHMRSFLEKNITIIYTYCKRNKYFEGVEYTEQWDYARTIELFTKIWKWESWNFEAYFDAGEYNKLYAYTSKHTHFNKKFANFNYNIDFSEETLVQCMETIWMCMFMSWGMFYAFLSEKIELYWLTTLLKPIPYERSFYRYVIWDLLKWCDTMIFNTINEKRLNDFFVNEIKLDVDKFDYSKQNKL